MKPPLMRVKVDGGQRINANLARQNLTTPCLTSMARRTSSPYGRTFYTNEISLESQRGGNEEKRTFSSTSRGAILLLRVSLTILLLLGGLGLLLLLLLLTLLLLVGNGLEVVELGLFGSHERRCRSGKTAKSFGLVRALLRPDPLRKRWIHHQSPSLTSSLTLTQSCTISFLHRPHYHPLPICSPSQKQLTS